jgi:hypothetical protein
MTKKSQIKIPVMGAMKIAYADMKLRKVVADSRIIQGHRAQPPSRNPRIPARRMLRYLGMVDPISATDHIF